MNNNLRGISGLPRSHDPYNSRPITPPQLTPTSPLPHHQNQSQKSRDMGDEMRGDLVQKLAKMSEQVYELVFLKESVLSAVGEQRMRLADSMRELKKWLFQLEIRSERDTMNRPSLRPNDSTHLMLVNSSSLTVVAPQNPTQLTQLCEQLAQQNQSLKLKYEQMLVKYREEIQFLSTELSPPQENNLHEQNIRLKRSLAQLEEQLKSEQMRYVERVKYLQSEIIGLEDEYMKERGSIDEQLERIREKERQLIFRESEVDRKNILLIEREKQLTEREIMMKQERITLDRRETKISDYEHNQLRREKQKIEQEKMMRSQYYNSYGNIPDRPYEQRHNPITRYDTHHQSERERSTGNRLINSRVDINARLKEIEQERKRTGMGIKGSRMSQAGGARHERSSSKGRQQPYTALRLREAVSTQNVNTKLDSMLELMQKDLNDIK